MTDLSIIKGRIDSAWSALALEPDDVTKPRHPGALIYADRLHFGETRKVYARRLGIGEQMLADIEKGRRGISVSLAVRLERITERTAFGWLAQNAAWNLRSWIERYGEKGEADGDN